MMRLEALLPEVEHLAAQGDPETKISGIASDSRLVKPGDLFVAIPGSEHDGHDYIREAVERGAAGIVGEKALSLDRITYIQVSNSRRALADLAAAFYSHPTNKLFTVGITGTNGKTTVAYLVESVLGEEETELVGTVVNDLERGLTNTTPDPLTVQQIAYEALNSGKQNFVLEVSAHGLSQERVRGIDFDATVFTNLTHDHLDYYKGWDEYLKAKLKLFSKLKQEGLAIINKDDPHSDEFIKRTKARLLSYGLSPDADIWADRIQLRADHSRFIVHTPREVQPTEIPINTRLLGKFNIYNILAAIGVGQAQGVSLNKIKRGIERVDHIEGRFERFRARAGFHVVIDFAHSPDALEKMTQALKPHYRRVITLFGCGGESDRAKRPIMGRISGRLSAYTIITSDNPKDEEPEQIIKEIESGIQELNAPYESIVDRKEAIRRAVELARPGDVVLIAGKGHEQTQIFKDKVIKFNDKEFLKEEGLI